MPNELEVPPMSDVCGALQTLGYVIIDAKETPICSVVAGHSMSLKIVLLIFADAVMVDGFWPLTERGKSDAAGVFALINSLNAACSMVGCSLGNPAPDLLRFRALFLGPFDGPRFSAFMRHWKRDIEEVFMTVITKDPGFLEQ